jgi:hypothetical protein
MRAFLLRRRDAIVTSALCLLALFVFAATLAAASVAGLKWTPPAGWKSTGTTSMRAATYPVAPAAGDHEGGECVVYYFGQGQGGPVQANIQRWESQFTTAPGHPAPAKVVKRTVHGLAVTTIDVSGTYSGMGGPLSTQTILEKNYRLLGAIIEGPEGNIFIKFVAPARTMAANQSNFERLVNSFEKSSGGK